MTNIEKFSHIKPEALDGSRYFLSLLEAASDMGLLSEAQAESIRADCFELLARITRRYTGTDSSSLRIETAQELLESALFTLGVGLKASPTPDDALAALLSGGTAEIFRLGRARIDRLLSRSKALHTSLMANLFQTPNEFYSATIIGGIGGFFKLYRPDYFAHELHITADYPTLCQQPPLLGAEFICRYLQCLSMENAFLSLFGPNAAGRLLLAYDRHYAKLPINLCEPVLCAALGCMLTNEPPLFLRLSPDGAESLSRLFAGGAREIQGHLEAALAALSAQLKLPVPLTAYLGTSLPQLAIRAENAAAHGSLETLFPIS